MIIYTESDYLKAHLTEISPETHNWSDAIDLVPQRLTDALKKFTATASPTSPSPKKSRPAKSRSR